MPPVRRRRDPRADQPKLEATRRAIQHEYIRLLSKANFSFELGAKEPRGLQARIVENVNEMRHGDGQLSTNQAQVYNWVKRVRDNNWQVTDTKTDYSKTSQNSRKFFEAEQKRIRDAIRNKKLKSHELPTVWSDKEQDVVSVSATSARRYLKRKYSDEPSMIPAKPKGMTVGGETPHHARCRLHESLLLKMKGQDYINGMFHADESKMKFKERKNKQIDIIWVYRGQAGEANWFEDQRHPGQVNLFLMQSRNGIEYYETYDKTLNMTKYKERILPQVGRVIRDSENFSCYLHDNCWRGAQPVDELNQYCGENKWTQYMGKPCTVPHPTAMTPVHKIPVRMPAPECKCTFPAGPVLLFMMSMVTKLV